MVRGLGVTWFGTVCHEQSDARRLGRSMLSLGGMDTSCACLLGSRVARYTLIILLLWLWAGDGLRWRAGVLDCNGGFAFTLL